ncbi:hypothetical protein B0T16DRAFT_408344 [Cercophora newfieldiana]|uniref:Oxidoreductase-like protein n=1 Tax=Cercophora newfieldiana TaxID=92897 RepID=A0AA39YBH9_9PEZI|nr:hypothetical protein B0T16DRAFT_408344 [Cercophora newfieldiana]
MSRSPQQRAEGIPRYNIPFPPLIKATTIAFDCCHRLDYRSSSFPPPQRWVSDVTRCFPAERSHLHPSPTNAGHDKGATLTLLRTSTFGRPPSTMAARPQEARSLSDINYVAANPPQYPHHPEVRESLTLYISRVPGTRDIILSTLKPQRKNVTGEDVANSLYYVHLDLPTDELLAAPRRRPQDATSPRSSGESARTIPRKPLPSTARPLKPENNASTASAANHGPATTTLSKAENDTLGATDGPITPANNGSGVHPASYGLVAEVPQASEKSAIREHPDESSEQAPELPPRPQVKVPPSSGVPLVRKPLGPRPLVTPERELPGPPTYQKQERPVTPTHYSPQSVQPAQVVSPSQGVSSFGAWSPTKAGRRPAVLPFSLTLIRRDATTGGQWNVGKISSFQTNIPTPETADPRLNPDDMGDLSRAQKIDIKIETSGYAKYRGMPSIATVDAYQPGSGQSFVQAMKGLGPASGPGSTIPTVKGTADSSEDGFRRQVLMAYSKTWSANSKAWTTNIKHTFQRRRAGSAAADGQENFSPEDLAAPRGGFHRRGGSESSVDSATWGDGRPYGAQKTNDPASPQDGGRSSPPTLTTEPGPGLKPKGYMFVSPWEGRCEFRTSTNGRSLKCRHILDPKSHKFNPAAVAQNIRDAQGLGRSRGDELTSALAGAKPVSELRFNLPGTNPSKTAQGETGKGKWDPHVLHGQFSKLLHLEPRSSDDDDYEDDDAPMDLSLGREDAGGGHKGNRAKLGKLIIHDEGLKMLDLVVAANVGVWWTTWERTF